MKWLKKLWRFLFGRRPDLTLKWCEGDAPPERLKRGELVVAREGNEFWAAAFICPCGCGERIELALIPEAKPRWRLTSDIEDSPSLHPSVWRKVGCKSHFWVKDGKVTWC